MIGKWKERQGEIVTADKVKKELAELSMKNAKFEVKFETLDENTCDETGFDRIEFMFTANSGQPLKPLNKVASGGEMSRFMLAVKNITLDSGYTYQGMLADDKYLYFPNGNNRTTTTEDRAARNRISVYLHDGTLFKHIEVMIPIEVEGLALYQNRCYANCNSQSASLIFETDLYTSTADGYIGLPDVKNIVDYVQNLYIDETYNGFKMNGSSGYPISSLYWWYMFVKPNTTRININLMSDASDKVFAIFGDYHQYISFDGHNHKLKRINWSRFRASS